MEIFALFEKNVIWEPVTFFNQLVGEYEFSDSFEWAENHAKTGKLQAQLSQDSFYWVVLEWVFLGLVILASVAAGILLIFYYCALIMEGLALFREMNEKIRKNEELKDCYRKMIKLMVKCFVPFANLLAEL